MNTATIKKWGNSQGILINKSILASTNMIIGDQVSIITDKDKIIIQKTPAKQTLEDLFEGYSGTYKCEEISLEPVGKEF